MSNQCPRCGCENRARARFCAECGAGLPALSSIPAGSAHTNGSVEQEPLQAHPTAVTLLEFPGADEETSPHTTNGPAVVGEDGAEEPANQPSDLNGSLASGDVIADRFCILAGSLNADGQRVYIVEDRGVCRACGCEIAAAADEPYCTHCGGHLPSLALPWPLRRLQEIDAPVGGESQITWGGRLFAILEAADAENEDEAVESRAHVDVAPADRPSAPVAALLAGQRSDVGEERRGRANEDSLLTLTLSAGANSAAQPLGLYLVADGMGGHMDGEIASRTACERIGAELLQSLVLPILEGSIPTEDDVLDQIEQAIQAANRQIAQQAAAASSNMGTTLALAFALGNQVYLANVGDSRAYLWGRAGLRQLTEDHSHVFLLKQQGVIEEEEIYTHPRRNEIYRSLGAAEAVKVDCRRLPWAPGDSLLLCSDGLWEMLRNEGIADVLMMNWGDPQVVCDELVSRANAAGGEDNISAIVVRAVGELL